MWFSFWRPRSRFSVDELRYLNDQLQKVHSVNDTNKDFVIETLRSIAELVTYGDQHDPAFFEFFMEKQVMSQFLRILKFSKTESIAIQLLQTLSIMIQNLHSEQGIYYLFSNGYVNYLILYPFDFHNEELLNYYIYFLRTVSGKLDKNTISLLVKTQNDEVISFPLYSEAIKFVHHEENMVRIAVRALTLNIYHVSDEFVHKFIISPPLSGYFLDLVKILRQQCFKLDALVVDTSEASDFSQMIGKLNVAVAEIGENLCYCNDIICAGVPCLSRLMTHHLLHSLFLTILLPSLHSFSASGTRLSARTSLYLLSFILQEIRFKDLVNSIGAALLYPPMAYDIHFDSGWNGGGSAEELMHGTQNLDQETKAHATSAMVVNMDKLDNNCNALKSLETSSPNCELVEGSAVDQKVSLREVLVSYVDCENEKLIFGSLSMLISLEQNKELDDSISDALGILPQRKQHKKLLLQALVGSNSDEEQLFSSSDSWSKDEPCNELELSVQNLKDEYALPISSTLEGMSPVMHKHQVLDALIMLLCRRPSPSTEVLWLAGSLLRLLHPYQKQNFCDHLKLLNDAYRKASDDLLREVKDCWCDQIPAVLEVEWKTCNKAIERPELEKGSMFVLLPEQQLAFPDGLYYSYNAAQRMLHAAKVFILHYHLRSSFSGGAMCHGPQLGVSKEVNENSRVRRAGLDILVPKIGTEFKLDDALPCRIAFERGKERPFFFLAVSKGKSGSLLLAEAVPLKPHQGIVRVAAPLAGSNPRIDEKHPRWLHLRIRPVNLPSMESAKFGTNFGRAKTKDLLDGRWTLAFPDEELCKSAMSAVLEEMAIQSSAVEEELEPLLGYDVAPNAPHLKVEQEDHK